MIRLKAKISLGAIELIAETELEGRMLKAIINENYKAAKRITRPFGKDKHKYHFGALWLDKIAKVESTEIQPNQDHRYLRGEKNESAN